jgi:hypothetical protein
LQEEGGLDVARMWAAPIGIVYSQGKELVVNRLRLGTISSSPLPWNFSIKFFLQSFVPNRL